ncbi:hypothetical protein [Legionella gresilensis]|uniref:hypothetical protein n=1 Tax=Legionella gresilensis TaxID=91823 RepID=UPI0010419FEA|nr:hypothetical protein [Legionella gresilensis]
MKKKDIKLPSLRNLHQISSSKNDNFKFNQYDILSWKQSFLDSRFLAWTNRGDYETLSDAVKDLSLEITLLNLRIEAPVDVKDLVEALSKLHPGIETLDFNLSSLGLRMSTRELMQVFAAIPKHVTTLSLANNKLGTKTSEELAQILKAIPNHVMSLDLSNNDLRAGQIIKAFPNHIKTLNLSSNCLGDSLDLKELIQLLPNSITSLDLSYNNLGKSLYGIGVLLACIPSNINTLDISGNNFTLTANEMEFVLEFLPNHVRNLKGFINVVSKRGLELAQVISTMPEQLTSLDLSRQLIGYFDPTIEDVYVFSADELVPMVKAIPKNIITLDLSHNQLNEMGSKSLVQMFAALPSHISSLNLSDNGFDKLTATELARIFASIPKQVSSFNLSSNNFGYPGVEDLAQVFAAIPAGVTHLNLSQNEFGRSKYQCKNLDQAFSALPKHVSSLNLAGNKLEMLSVEELEKFAGTLPYIKTIELSYKEIREMSFEQRQALKSVFNNVEKVIWCDEQGSELQFKTGHALLETQRYARELCGKLNSSPSKGGIFYSSSANGVVDKALEGKEEVQQRTVTYLN